MNPGFSQTMGDGRSIPMLGLGTYLSHPAEVGQAVGRALDVGYRHIDTASFYGNEEAIGRAIRESGVARQEVFITTKVWNDEQGYDETLRAFEASTKRMGLDYIDLYLVHWPRPLLMEDTWAAMEDIRGSGGVRSIGVSNFLAHHLDRLASFANVMPVVNQIEFHPHLQSPAVLEACVRHGVMVEAWSPLKRGRLLDDPLLVEIAGRHGVTSARVIIRWLLQREIIAIPKSVTPERIAENADVYSFVLGDAEVDAIHGMDRDERIGPHPDLFGG